MPADLPKTSVIRAPGRAQPLVQPPATVEAPRPQTDAVADPENAPQVAQTLPLDANAVRAQAATLYLDVVAPMPARSLQPDDQPTQDIASLAGPATTADSRLLHREEAERAQVFGRIMFALCGLVLLWIPLLSRGDGLEYAMATALIALGATGLAVSRIAVEPLRYTTTLFRFFGAVAVLASTVIEYYLGVFSPTALAVTLGIGFFGQGGDRTGSLAIGISASAAYALMAFGMASGLMADRGLFDATAAAPGARWFMCAVVPVVLLVTLLQARTNRQAAQDLAARAATAARQVAQQEAQFREVRDELDAMVRPQGGALGPASGKSAGQWRLESVVGRGGFGEVYAARSVAGGATAAVKVLRSAWIDNDEMMARFRREADIIRQLRSPHLVSFLGAGTLNSGEPYIAMELLQGVDLASTLRDRGRLTDSECLKMAADVCEGLAVVHRAGCVHRDIKPQNLFFAKADSGSCWKILDFGVSGLLVGDDELTVGARPLGTPAYMSPEQARGERVDPRSDVFSLGCVLYRAAVGHAPFRVDRDTAIVQRERPVAPRLLCPNLSPDLSVLLTIALAPNPRDRFSHAVELLEAIRQTKAGQLGSNWWMLAAKIASQHPWSSPRPPS